MKAKDYSIVDVNPKDIIVPHEHYQRDPEKRKKKLISLLDQAGGWDWSLYRVIRGHKISGKIEAVDGGGRAWMAMHEGIESIPVLLEPFKTRKKASRGFTAQAANKQAALKWYDHHKSYTYESNPLAVCINEILDEFGLVWAKGVYNENSFASLGQLYNWLDAGTTRHEIREVFMTIKDCWGFSESYSKSAVFLRTICAVNKAINRGVVKRDDFVNTLSKYSPTYLRRDATAYKATTGRGGEAALLVAINKAYNVGRRKKVYFD